MTVLMMGPYEREKLAELAALAMQRPVDMIALSERIKTPEGKADHMARMTEQTLPIPAAYLVTYSVETGHPAGMCRHMSMSVKREGRLPNHQAVEMVMKELGFTGTLGDCTTWVEDLKTHGQAINVVQPIIVAEPGTA